MFEKNLTVNNRDGIHCRPATEILSAVSDYPECDFTISCENGETKLQSMLEILSLQLSKGSKLSLKVSGPNEEDAGKKIGDLFEYEFDFPPRD